MLLGRGTQQDSDNRSIKRASLLWHRMFGYQAYDPTASPHKAFPIHGGDTLNLSEFTIEVRPVEPVAIRNSPAAAQPAPSPPVPLPATS